VKPYSDACERNREPILQVLRQWFTQPGTVLEIGAGTGQHAVHFATHLTHLQWQPTDCEANLAGIGLWVSEAALPNLRAPVKLDVRDSEWPVQTVDYVFSANTAHIMGWTEVELMFAGIARVLRARGMFALYGPFNRDGNFTSESNRAFDASLRERDPKMGLRDEKALQTLGRQHGLAFTAEHAMPANNRLLLWSR
jgi:cyclopropane fatty-acyl-phospholipid synthase-like methyltransferase